MALCVNWKYFFYYFVYGAFFLFYVIEANYCKLLIDFWVTAGKHPYLQCIRDSFMPAFKSCMLWNFTFRSSVSLEYILVYGVRYGFNYNFFQMSGHHSLGRLTFPYRYVTSNCRVHWGHFWVTSHLPMQAPLSDSHEGLTPHKTVWQGKSSAPPLRPLFFQVSLPMFASLLFQVKFQINLGSIIIIFLTILWGLC